MSTKIIIRRKEDKFQWTQTDEAITLYFPVRNVLLKNVDVLYTPEFIKINVTSIRYIAIVDFANLIDNENIKNKVFLQDEGLEVYLMKAESAKHRWDDISLKGLTREQLIKRREESLNRHYKREEEKFKEAADLKIKMDKHVVDQQMKLEDYQRKQLKQIKEEQKQLAENELYHELDSLEQKNKQLLQQKQQIQQQNQFGQEHQNKENQNKTINKITAPIVDSTSSTKNYSFKQSSKEKDIFGDDDEIETVPSNYNFQNNLRSQQQPPVQNEKDLHSYVEEITEEEAQIIEQQINQVEPEPVVPEVRNKQDVKVPFTEKKFPHLPARESQLKEPPYPKSKQIVKKKDDVYIDIEDKDPVWLKDKGDHFFKRNDYYSAANAYTKALEFDKEFLMGRLNRATAFIKMRAFQNCVDDCGDIETQILALKESELEDEFYQKLLARMYVKRGAACSWLSMFDKAVEDLTKASTYKGIFTDLEIYEIQQDIEKIKIRQRSQTIKQEGDEKFVSNDLDGALQSYHEALKLDDKNEYAHANIGLIHLKRSDYQQCIEHSTKALDILEHFMNETKSFQRDNRLEVKVLLRRGKSYEMLEQIEQAKDDLDKAVSLEPQNGEAKTLLKKVQEKLDTMLFEQYNKQANDYQKQANFAGALEFYEKCLKLTRKVTSLENIAVYVNKIACLLSLEKHDRVVTECNDALRLIKNFKNRNEQNQPAEEKKRLHQMEIRVSVRRGNALAKLNRITDAIQEYEKALKLDPQNETIIRDLDVLRKGI